jgi:uncharacterized protein YndB with AHSA1/START domain
MQIITTIIVLLLIIIAAILILAARRPSVFRVERSTRIKAPAEKIFPLINDFHAWGNWSPYEKLDPAMKRTFSGAALGKGAVYGWEGNGKAGAGRMEIADVAAPSKVTIKLDFTKPFRASNMVDFTMVPQGGATQVTWAMHGPAPFMTKLFGLFMDMDKMIGKDFEQGLANLKAAAE